MTIVRSGGGYSVKSESTGRNLGGPYASKAQAAKRLRQVEYFKHQGATKKSVRGSKPMSNKEVQKGHRKEPAGVLAFRRKAKPGAIMKPSTFKKIERSAAAHGATNPKAVAGAAYWRTAEAKAQGKRSVKGSKHLGDAELKRGHRVLSKVGGERYTGQFNVPPPYSKGKRSLATMGPANEPDLTETGEQAHGLASRTPIKMSRSSMVNQIRKAQSRKY